MPRKRMIDPSFWTDEKLGECTRDERLLFMGLISNADDEGYGRANPKLLRSSIFPYDDLRVSDLEKWLSRLGGFGMIALYEVNGQTYYYLPNFTKHQTINKPTPSVFPKPQDASSGDPAITTVGLQEDYRRTTVGLPPKRKEEKRREVEKKENTPLTPQVEPRAQENDKTAYAEFVHMTEAEYQALAQKVGEPGAKRCIEILDNYKGATGKKYKSDYRAILNWVISRYREEPHPEPEETVAYAYPTPEENMLTEIEDGDTLSDVLRRISAEDAS